MPKKGTSREQQTLQLLSRFSNKMKSVLERESDSEAEKEEGETQEDDDENDDKANW